MVISNGFEVPDKHRTGRSEYLLCRECELRFSLWETCAANWFYNWEPAQESLDEKGIIYKDINYPEFRLYCLSLLWRLSVSTLEYFDAVSLSSDDSETIRIALLSSDTLDSKFPICFTKLVKPDGEVFPISMQPYVTGQGSGKCFHLITNGLVHDFWLSDQRNNLSLKHCSLRPTGTLVVPIFPFMDFPPVKAQIALANKND